MTEAEWLVCADPTPMLEFLRRRASDRKLRLFACACCRQIWDRITHAKLRNAVDVSERFADQEATAAELKTASDKALRVVSKVRVAQTAHWQQVQGMIEAGARDLPRLDPGLLSAASAAKATVVKGIGVVLMAADSARTAVVSNHAPQRDQAGLLRDIFGNPLHKVTINTSWLTSTVVSLVNDIYEKRAFDRMPILADALQDAGCDNDEILNHCRQPCVHVRGCWVVDLLTGRK
jgi:hypothetical protein